MAGFNEAWGDLDQPAADARLAVLQQFADSIPVVTHDAVRAAVQPGYTTNLGQEWKLIVQSKRGGPEVTLFRAHLPLGSETYLDLYDDELITVPTPEELTQRLQQFAQSDAARSNLRVLMQRA